MQDMNVETGAHGCLCILDQFSVSVIGTVFLCILDLSTVLFVNILCLLQNILCAEMLEYNLMHYGWCVDIVF